MKKYAIFFTKQAKKDVDSLSPKLKKKLQEILLEVISVSPYSGKKLLGELKGSFSYRLNLKDRIVYSINEKEKRVYIERARTHYGD